jgi:hypothetical protein
MLEKIADVCLVDKLHAIQLYQANFNCYNQFIFGQNTMQALTASGYVPEELFSQKCKTAKDAKFDKTLMADLSRQARHPMIVTLADAAYCYDRVNHVIMSLVWLVLTNGMPPNNEIFSEDGFRRIQNILWRPVLFPLHYGIRARQQIGATIMGST